MLSFINPFIIVKTTANKGRGVFCNETIEANTLIEIAPVIVLNEKDTATIHQTHLHDYYFSWGENQKQSAIALGYVSMYNHAENSNCYYEADFEKNTLKIFTKFNIQKGEELTINYNMDSDSEKNLWFKVV